MLLKSIVSFLGLHFFNSIIQFSLNVFFHLFNDFAGIFELIIYSGNHSFSNISFVEKFCRNNFRDLFLHSLVKIIYFCVQFRTYLVFNNSDICSLLYFIQGIFNCF
jgi:hypothetical protein